MKSNTYIETITKDFKKGDVIICENSHRTNLKNGHRYELKSIRIDFNSYPWKTFLAIDHGSGLGLCWYNSNRFVVSDESKKKNRNDKISQHFKNIKESKQNIKKYNKELSELFKN